MTAIITPNHIGSKPIVNNTGPTRGTIINVISIKSRINPSRNINSITANVAEKTPPGRLLRKVSMSSSPPKPRKIEENIVMTSDLKDLNDEFLESTITDSDLDLGLQELDISSNSNTLFNEIQYDPNNIEVSFIINE